MVPEETREVADSLLKSQSKSDISQLGSPVMVTSTNVPEIFTASDCQETLPALREQSSEDQVCDTVMPTTPNEDVSSRIPEIFQPWVDLAEAESTELPLNVEEALIREEDNRTSHDFDAILGQVIPEELAFHFLDPSSTFDIQGSASSYQGAQGTGSPPSSSFLHQNITTAAEYGPQVEHLASRTAPLGGGVQPPNISYDGPTVNASADTSLPNNPMGQNPQLHFLSFNDIYDYQLEKLNREQGSLQKSFEETTSELKAELDRKMAEIQREYDRKFQEVDAEYINQAMKEEVYRSSVVMSSLLSNGFMSKCTDRSIATGIAAVRARSSQPSTQQQQTVQRNTHMNSTASTRSCVTVEAPIPNASAARSSQPSTQQQQSVQRNTHMNSTAPPRPSVISEAPISNPSAARSSQHSTHQQQQAVQRNTHMNLTPPRPSVIAEAPIPDLSGPLSHSPLYNTTQLRPISQQAAVQPGTPMNSTALSQPSVTAGEPRPLHSPRCNMPRPRPISQQAMVRTNTHVNLTAHPRPSITSEALPLHSPLNNTPRTRPPPLIPNHIPSYSAAFTPPVQGVVRAMPPHLRSSRAPNFGAAASTTNPTRLVQEQQEQQEKSNGGLVYLSDDE